MYKLVNYKTLIFDFGGVILNINKQLTIDAFAQIVGKQAVGDIIKSKVIKEYEKGSITSEIFYKTICELSKKNIEIEKFKKAWNAMLLNYENKRIEKLKELKTTHKLILLSNTNEWHFNYFSKKLNSEFKINFEDIFSSIYLSYKVKLLKPDVNIFKKVLETENLIPNETLFVEDTTENAKAANTLNIQTLVIPQNDNFYNYF